MKVVISAVAGFSMKGDDRARSPIEKGLKTQLGKLAEFPDKPFSSEKHFEGIKIPSKGCKTL